jgi:hypothetical protein
VGLALLDEEGAKGSEVKCSVGTKCITVFIGKIGNDAYGWKFRCGKGHTWGYSSS